MDEERVSPREEALREGGNKADFDKQTNNCFYSRESSIRISQCHVLGKETSSMETADAQDKCFIPSQMWCDKVSIEQIKPHKAENDDEIGNETAQRSVTIARKQI